MPSDRLQNSRRIRIAYLSGPTDAVRIYDDLTSGAEPNYFGTNYMRQFLLLVQELDAQAFIATWHDGLRQVQSRGQFTFFNAPTKAASGLRYHAGLLAQQLAFLRRFLQFRPDILVLTGNERFWWVFAPLRLIGTRMIASFHSVLWPKFHPLKADHKLWVALNKWLILRQLNAAVLTSEDIRLQLQQATGESFTKIPVFEHLPSYQRTHFQGIRAASELEPWPFRTMFMGRIEENKGVFDLLSVATELERKRPGSFKFDYCGTGSDLARLRESIRAANLGEVVTCHGYCKPEQMREVMSRSHVVAVPTRKDLEAGFEMTCAEAILGGRPLITSAVSPALHYLKPAAIEVRPNCVEDYERAVEMLADDRRLYAQKLEASGALQEQFFSFDRSWDSAMRKALASIGVNSVP
jgi:glycogen(starch) synthase